tara:strand:+ start:312 stop:827 length:516 start_codon:yes stop_codon:yes gene_type:complete
MIASRLLLLIIFLYTTIQANAHPLKLSLCEIEYSSEKKLISVNLKLFLTDVNEAIVFDPYSKDLAFCQTNESKHANRLLLNYLNQFFYIKVNSKILELEIKNKNLKGEGDNTALWLQFEYIQTSPLQSLEIKNAVFTDLFFDQNNIVYIHIDEKSKSLMLDKKKSIHQLRF